MFLQFKKVLGEKHTTRERVVADPKLLVCSATRLEGFSTRRQIDVAYAEEKGAKVMEQKQE